ncbi:MAG: septation protein SepH [Actinomycetota bacterium]
MSELRVVGRTSDGERIELADGEGNSFTVKIDESLKSAMTERKLVAVSEDAPTFSIKEIQARLRAGESFAEVARISGLSINKIERYASPIMQERAWVIEQAEKSSPKGTTLPLRELVVQRLAPRGVNMNQISWNTWRLDNGSWHLVLSYPSSDGNRQATWHFDLNKRTFNSQDDGAKWICGEEISKHPTKQDRMSDHGVLFPVEGDSPQPPRLVAVRTDPSPDDAPSVTDIPTDAKKDGVTRRISIPSWDDIMFGRSKKKDGEDES